MILFERLLIHPGASQGEPRYIEMGRHRPIFTADRRLKERFFCSLMSVVDIYIIECRSMIQSSSIILP